MTISTERTSFGFVLLCIQHMRFQEDRGWQISLFAAAGRDRRQSAMNGPTTASKANEDIEGNAPFAVTPWRPGTNTDHRRTI